MVMAGGTGGHIFPALAVAKEMQSRGWTVVWLGAKGRMEAELVPRHGIPIELLAIGGVRGQGMVRKLVQPFEQAVALWKSVAVIFRHRPDAVIGFGGFTGFAGGLAATLLWKPLLIHEQNSVAGLTNKVLSHLADYVLTAFPNAFAARGTLVGNPVRPEIAALPAPAERFASRSGPLRILVVGGSLGATALNTVVPQALACIPAEQRPQVIHQAGHKQLEALRNNYVDAGVSGDCVAFIDDMALAYGDADLVICRAGALTVAELAAAGVASILVPYPHAVDDHQTGNAKYLSDAGAGILVQQSDLTPKWLAAQLTELTREHLVNMAEAARNKALPAATQVVADIIEEVTA
ncbi:undecaprenyldiphospho-muramoylpentapeptide beta-N-acetylglucosaminyltransferase [Chitinimonas sp. BJB300]|uniref:undecaprenyldiphospho-muramoylpentapeptide beta-N-acetylglucosaminyltransferase n=1 Tax=Chitinimonas sp. BJB300 TaxID=1559339 RepID=UPI000C11A85A|nr:undecaprenyldiphospho-muramoylpentapeptide beta-N-acetylglucosaminyltransferase [Chitinimonas sp. BJB300]PHV12805.1 undecaprenyldiphospho-muramoylpentapeptide beta-N-acetylglucosaminyltransferase [Chitinimonas sp. BJB300]TSJ91671.1 undecaprenyldiphospho-muramoylpentapeptide beta-N-acetylglucosaminyltransferase [Chitinimonas sp. BJB300]